RIVFIAKSEIESEIRKRFEFILRIALIESAAVADDSLALQIARRRRDIVDEIFRARVAERYGGKAVSGVVEAYTHDIDAELESMAIVDPREIVDAGERGADFGIERCICQAAERG